MDRRAFLLAMTAVACTKKRGEPTTLVGAGATLPHPLYTRWSAEYARVDPAVRINYQPLGSGAGQHQITDGVVDFGAADEPLDDAPSAPAPGLVQVPATIGSVVVVCNLHGVGALELTPDLAADVFLGDVMRWDDDRIRAKNPNAKLPSEPIKVVYRAEGSGTSAAFTASLAKAKPAFGDKVGLGKTPRFPVGVGARGSNGLVGIVESLPGAVGYVEVAYAKSTKLVVARMDAISALSLIVVPTKARDAAKRDALGRFLRWAVHDGQKFAPEEGYVPLTPVLLARAESALRSLGVSA